MSFVSSLPVHCCKNVTQNAEVFDEEQTQNKLPKIAGILRISSFTVVKDRYTYNAPNRGFNRETKIMSKASKIFALSDLPLQSQMIISEQIRKHLEKTGSVYSDEWGFTRISDVKIQIDLSVDMS